MSIANPAAGSITGRAASNASVVGRTAHGVIPGVDPLLGAALRLWKRHPPSIALPVLAGTVDMSGSSGRPVGEMVVSEEGEVLTTAQYDEEASRTHRRQVTELEGRIEAYMCRTSLRETWLVEDFMCWLSLLSDFESILLRVTEGSNNAPIQPAKPHSSEVGKRSSIFNRIVNALNSPPHRRVVSSAASSSTVRPVTVEELYPTSYNGGHKNPFGNHCPQTSSADPSPFLLHLAHIQFQEKMLQQRLQRICAQRSVFEDGKRLALQAVEAAQAAGNNYSAAKKASSAVMTIGGAASLVPGGHAFITAPTTPLECDEYLANLRMQLELKEEADYSAMTAPAAKQEAINDTIDNFGCCSDWVLTIPADQSIPVKRTRANIKTFLQWHVLVPLKSALKPNSRPFQNLQLARESAALKKAELVAAAEAAAKQQMIRESSLESISRNHNLPHSSPLSNGSLVGVDNHSAIFNDLMTVSNFTGGGSPQDPSGSRESMRYSTEGSMYERMQSMNGGGGNAVDSIIIGGGTPPVGGSRGDGSGGGEPRDSIAPSSLELMSSRGSVATYYGFGPETGKGTTQPRGFPQHKQRQPRLRISQAERQRMQHDRLQSFAERIRRRYVSAQSVQQCGVEVILRGDPYWASLPEEINKGYDIREYCERPPSSSTNALSSSPRARKPSAAQQALAASHAHYKGLFSETHAPYEGVLRLFGPGWGAMDGNIIPIVKIQQLDLSSLLTRSQMKELSRRIARSNVPYQTGAPDHRNVSPSSPVHINAQDDLGVVPDRSVSSVSSGAVGDGGFPGGKSPTITVVLMGKSFFMTKPIRIGAAKYFGYRHDRSDRALQLISDVDPSGRLLQYLTDAVVNIIEQWNTYDVQPPARRPPAVNMMAEGDKLGGDTAQSSRNTSPHRRSPSPQLPVHHSDPPPQQKQQPVVIAVSASKPPLSANSDGGESADGSGGAGPDGSLEHSFVSGRGAATPRHNQGGRSFAGRSSGMMSRTHSNQPIRISSDVGVSLRGIPDEMGTLRSTSVALPTVEGSTYAGAHVGVATHLAPTKKKTNLVLLDQGATSKNSNSVLDGIGDDTTSLFNEVIHRSSSLDDGHSGHQFGNDPTVKEGGGTVITNVSFLGKLKNVFGNNEGTKQPMADLMADERGSAAKGRSFQDLEGGTIGDDALDSALLFNSELHPKYKRNNDSRVDDETNVIRTNRMLRSRADSITSPCSTPTSDTSLHRMHATPSSHPNHPSLRPNHPTALDLEEQEEHFMTQCSMAMDQMQEVVRTIRSCTEYACEKLQNNAISVRRTSFCISLAVESYIHAQLYDGFVFPIFTAMYTNDETQLQTTRSRLLVDPPTSAEFADGCDIDLCKRGSWVNKRTGDRVISPCYFGASKEFWKFDPSPYAGLVESIATMAATPFDKLQRIRALFLLVAEQGQRLSTLYRGRKVDDDDLPESEAFDMNDVTDSRWQEADGQAPVNMCADDMVAMFTVVLVWCGCRELYSQMQYLAVFHSEAAEEDSELEYAYVTFRVAVENIILEGKKKN